MNEEVSLVFPYGILPNMINYYDGLQVKLIFYA